VKKARPEHIERRKNFSAALRSGKYSQGRQVLYSGSTYCCLGVACDISKLGKWKPIPYSDGNISYKTETDSGIAMLPSEVREYYGFSDIGGRFWLPKGDECSLWECNDGLELTFEQIADILDYGPPGLCVEDEIEEEDIEDEIEEEDIATESVLWDII
jgi:hypothetical protein